MIICCATAWFLAACSNEYDVPSGQTGIDGNSIILDISSGTLPVSRATVPAEGAEVAVSHIDVLIFDENGNKKWSNRVSAPANKTGKITLAAKRENFDQDAKYWVYLIANSTHVKDDFDNLVNLNGLKAMTQEDGNIHMTGLKGEGLTLPETFLMDGIAYPEGSAEPTVAAAAPVVLYDGSKADDTRLAVTLRRAAAKVVVTINKGNDVTFDDSPQAHEAGYYLRNMPYTTSVVAGVGGEAELKNTKKTSGAYFNWAAEKITVTAYMYAHAWENESTLEQEVRLVMNIPMTYSKDTDPQLRESNYYQIPVCSGKVLNRNTCYMVTATVNAPGAENPSTPVTLTDLKYTVEDWADEMIEVGGEDGRPTYLTLNEYDLEMHNMENDHTSLIFTSSSEVHVNITSVYYYDKFGQKQTLTKIPNTDNEYGINTSTSNRPNWTNRCTVEITPDEGLNGKLNVYSTLPENNTIRYIEFEVGNDDGVKPRSVTVAQYPLEYITNVQGWYSYRSDFGGTTWENKGANGYVAASYDNNRWNYSKQSEGNFRSKVAEQKNDGTSDISYYAYGYSSGFWGSTWNETDDPQKTSASLNNARMYHVRITATSKDYTLGRPRITKDMTDPGTDNAKLVSPSFMIASQLGAVSGFNSVPMSASHCKEYVEVAQDGTVYDDWRLPTEAELRIIAKFQRIPGSAIDVVLAGRNYYSASGPVDLGQGNAGNFIRCIRDVYDVYDDKK